jgi:dTDP-3,4-didehydro-2,6-dideoxy-alpha-D-glucose 3-reductase
MNWGVVGCAGIAIKSVIPAILSLNENKLIAVASRSITKARIIGEQFGCVGVGSYEELLTRSDIDAVYIPLPTGMHFEWVMKALSNNKHVLVEKSAATNLKQAQLMVNLANEKRLALVENFQFQHHSQHKYVMELLRNEFIGELRCFRSSFGFPPFSLENNIRYDKALGGGALLDAGAYVLKATTTILGEGFEVNAAHMVLNKEYLIDWYGGAFLTNKANNIISEVAFGFDNFYQCNYEIWGSTGKITSTKAFTANIDYSPIIIIEKQGTKDEIILPKDDHFKNMIQYFNNMVNKHDYESELKAILYQSGLIDQVQQLSF